MNRVLALLAPGVFIVFVAVIVVPLGDRKSGSDRSSKSTTMTTNTTHPFFKLTSAAFAEGASIPARYTCDAMPADTQGERELSPALMIADTPSEAKSLALVMDDPDVPKAVKPDGVFDHWVLFNIPPDTKEIGEGGTAGTPGINGAGKNTYTGPCPPPQYEPAEHHYVFTLYALDTDLALAQGASKADVLAAIEGHVIAQTQLIGRYKRR